MGKTIKATLTLSGMIIGAGMFGIPFSFARAGFWLGTLELVILSAVILTLHLFYADLILRTPKIHRLPGYIHEHLGGGAYKFAWVSSVFGITGSLLAYLILGSTFLGNLFPRYDYFFWLVFLAAAAALITYFPLKKESLINDILTVFLIGFILYLIYTLFPGIQADNLRGFNLDSIFMPYGVLLFALAGGIVIPEVVILVDRNRNLARKAVVMGSLLPAVLYFLFALAVVGVSGFAVSQDAVQGLRYFAGEKIIFWGNLIGLLAIFTSLVAASKNFQEMLRLDFTFSRRKSWFVVSVVPLVLYILGFRNFISIIGLIGALAVGVDSALILAAHYKMQKKEARRFGLWSGAWRTAVFIMIILGIIYEVF